MFASFQDPRCTVWLIWDSQLWFKCVVSLIGWFYRCGSSFAGIVGPIDLRRTCSIAAGFVYSKALSCWSLMMAVLALRGTRTYHKTRHSEAKSVWFVDNNARVLDTGVRYPFQSLHNLARIHRLSKWLHKEFFNEVLDRCTECQGASVSGEEGGLTN